MGATIKVTDRPKHPVLPNPLPGGALVPDTWTCPVCGKSDPLVQGVFQHRCIITIG